MSLTYKFLLENLSDIYYKVQFILYKSKNYA